MNTALTRALAAPGLMLRGTQLVTHAADHLAGGGRVDAATLVATGGWLVGFGRRSSARFDANTRADLRAALDGLERALGLMDFLCRTAREPLLWQAVNPVCAAAAGHDVDCLWRATAAGPESRAAAFSDIARRWIAPAAWQLHDVLITRPGAPDRARTGGGRAVRPCGAPGPRESATVATTPLRTADIVVGLLASGTPASPYAASMRLPAVIRVLRPVLLLRFRRRRRRLGCFRPGAQRAGHPCGVEPEPE